ncbi:MAG: hypothetical protein AAF787_11475 [Chloroflexota bacterium]
MTKFVVYILYIMGLVALVVAAVAPVVLLLLRVPALDAVLMSIPFAFTGWLTTWFATHSLNSLKTGQQKPQPLSRRAG